MSNGLDPDQVWSSVGPGPRLLNFFMLNLTEHEISTARKS